MTGILFLDRWREKTAEINKARSVKYIRRYPKKTGKGYNYVYKDSWKHPFKALLECFGIKRKAVEENYAKHEIKKDFGADKQTFAAHVLEYFTNKIKWDNLFSKKEIRDKYKEPEQQKAVQERTRARSIAESVSKKPDGDKMIVNRSLMRKVWSIYSVEGQRIEATESEAGQKAAAKDGGNGGGNKTGGTVKEDLRLLSGVLEAGESSSVYNAELGEIVVDAGSTGKSGYGLKHIIEQRYKKDGKNIDEITALLPLVISAAKNGEVTRENSRFIEISKTGIIAIIRKEHDERNEKWVLTGFDDWSKQKEAKDAIETVIAKYSYAPEYSSFRKQVGAVIASLDNSVAKQKEKNKNESKEQAEEKKKKAEEYGFDLSNYYSPFSNEFHEAELDNDLYVCDRLSQTVKEYGLKKEEIRAFADEVRNNDGQGYDPNNDDSKWAFYHVFIPRWLRGGGEDLEQAIDRLGYEKAREVFNKMSIEYKDILNDKSRRNTENELTEAEKHANRSEAMKGNKNAEKNGSGDDGEPSDDTYPEKNYPEYKGKGQEAVDFIVKQKGGQVRGAFNRHEIGDIDVVWGEVTNAEKHTGYGLSHIIDKHGMDAARVIGEVIEYGKVVNPTQGRISIQLGYWKVALKQQFNGNKKIWIVTSFKNEDRGQTTTPSPQSDYTKGTNSETSTISIPESGMLESTDKQSNPPLFSSSAPSIPKPEKKSSSGQLPDDKTAVSKLTLKQKANLNTIKEILEKNIEPMPAKIEFTKENFDRLFKNGINSPIEHIKIGENQFEKLKIKNREDLLAAMYETLSNPTAVLNTESGAKLYIKSFLDEKNKQKNIVSVVVDKEDLHISISTHQERLNQISNKMSGILYKNSAPYDGSVRYQKKQRSRSTIYNNQHKKSSSGKADVKKSWCYFDKNGNLYFRKSAFSKNAS